ncbi:hypothetical protein [Streptomyces sp. NPDC088925]|uniref:hypothetical protein n=1 Tax=Streptomyces sp. NPDC088925 TaxID=3365914 RepID=UPI0037F9CFC0
MAAEVEFTVRLTTSTPGAVPVEAEIGTFTAPLHDGALHEADTRHALGRFLAEAGAYMLRAENDTEEA